MFLVAFFLALGERSGRRQPPAERSPCIPDYIRQRLKNSSNDSSESEASAVLLHRRVSARERVLRGREKAKNQGLPHKHEGFFTANNTNYLKVSRYVRLNQLRVITRNALIPIPD